MEFHKSLEEPHAEIQEKTIEQMHDDGDTSSPSIFTTPFLGLQFQEPHLASIGPYHCTKNLPLQQYKYSFLGSFISRIKSQGKDLSFYVQQMMSLECRARRCYSEDFSMPSSEFVELMLLDGCFVVEVLAHFGGGSEDWVFPIEPWQLPILVQDLLILENQIPFFVLKVLFESLELEGQQGSPTISLCTMALKFFHLAFPQSMDISCEFDHLEPHHLLDLFLQSIRPSDPSRFSAKTMALPKFVYSLLKKTDTRNQADVSKNADNVTNPKLKGVQQEEQCDPPPPFHLTDSVWELQASGIKLRPRMAARFTDIDFNNGMVEIPSLTIDDLFFTILINGVAFEHSSKTGSKDLIAYASFMSRLITCPTDVKILCSNGIISGFSHNDLTVINFFHSLRLKIGHLDIRHSYLSKRLQKLECYHTRRWSWRTLLFCITNLLFAFNCFRVGVSLMFYLVQQVRFIGNFTLFLFPEFPVVIMMFMVRETHIPTLTVDQQVIEDEDPVTVDEQVEDSVTVEDQHVEVEYLTRRHSRRVPLLETVSGEKYETVVDCVSLETDQGYYNEPWARVLENEVVWVLVSALRVI